MVRVKLTIGLVVIIIAIVLGVYYVYYDDVPSSNVVLDVGEERIREFSFYDIGRNCSLDGRVFVGEDYFSETEGGILKLEEIYLEDSMSEVKVSIEGTTSSCFGEDAGLPFKGVWTAPNLNYYFVGNDVLYFEGEFNPRIPTYFEEMQGFVRPEEVKNYLEINLEKYFVEGNVEGNLDRIAEYSVRYRSDFLLFGEGEYWQTPLETLRKGHGDCEDWAVTTLSLMRAYDSSIECYNSLWPIHLSIICFLDDSMIIYDQGSVKFKVLINPSGLSESERKVNVRTVRNNYFDEYGLEPGERMLYALFNENDLITFETEEDFVDWVVSRE